MADDKDDDTYVLGRDFAASNRLALQHFLMKQILGFNLHPNVLPLKTSAKVADIACGSCLWLQEVSQELPQTVSLNGFDISLAQCPPSEWLPQNVSLRKWNVFDEPPFDILGTFDLVHLRFVGLLVTDNDGSRLVHQIAKLLKPNGMLQWDEYENSSMFIKTPNEAFPTPALDRVRSFMSAPVKGKGSDVWKHHLPPLLERFGFENAVHHSFLESFQQNMGLAKHQHAQLISLVSEYIDTVYGEDIEGHQYRLMLKQAEDEAKAGAVLVLPMFIVTAQLNINP